LTELGTTWIKLGQVLSLRPDVVGDDVAAELTKLQAMVAADPPGVALALVERGAGWCGVRALWLVRAGADGVGVGRAGSLGNTP
jgi:ubiquinone biosynthesis protein